MFKAGRCWERLRAGGEGDNRGWDGWMASPTQWTWVWVDSSSWWRTERPGVLRFMGSQRVGHDWVTEVNWKLVEALQITLHWVPLLENDRQAERWLVIGHPAWWPAELRAEPRVHRLAGAERKTWSTVSEWETAIYTVYTPSWGQQGFKSGKIHLFRVTPYLPACFKYEGFSYSWVLILVYLTVTFFTQ